MYEKQTVKSVIGIIHKVEIHIYNVCEDQTRYTEPISWVIKVFILQLMYSIVGYACFVIAVDWTVFDTELLWAKS